MNIISTLPEYTKPKNVGLMFFSLEPDKFFPYTQIDVVKHPDRSVTIEGLKSYRVSNRRYRNRRIGDFLKELHLTEGRNTGFKKILNALEANGSPKPEFETDEDRSYFITRIFVHERFYEAEVDERKLSEVSKNERSLSEVLSEVLKKKEFLKVEKIIGVLEEKGEITPKEAEGVCGKSAATVRRYLNILAETGYIVTEGKNNNIVYKVVHNEI